MNIRTTTAFAAGAVVALVLGTGTAYAANGGNFKLGGNNYESREASLNNSNGTALTLRSKAGTPSLKVNRTTKVPNLNADMVDGLSSGQIARNVTRRDRHRRRLHRRQRDDRHRATTSSWPWPSARAAAR